MFAALRESERYVKQASAEEHGTCIFTSRQQQQKATSAAQIRNSVESAVNSISCYKYLPCFFLLAVMSSTRERAREIFPTQPFTAKANSNDDIKEESNLRHISF